LLCCQFRKCEMVKPSNQLERGLGLAEATALNMMDMVGIGPFIVMPLVIQRMGGPQCILAWVAGALMALLDGCVWAELGAAMPEAGGSYVFLREEYGAAHWGRLMSFLFVWQTMIQAPLVIASGAIGFAQYFSYLVPLGRWQQKGISAALIVLLVILLYQGITRIGRLSLFLWAGVIGTLLWIILAGATHFHAALAFDFPPGAWNLSLPFFAALGAATGQSIYTYWGYYNVCHLGGEIREPRKNIPRAIFFSIIGIAILYIAMQISVTGVLPWREAASSQFLVSTFFERLYGLRAARFATLLVLWVAFASLFALILGYSRIPYAAARDGNFFAAFARLHPTKHFPYVSLLVLGALGLVFSLLFRLRDVIAAILATRLLVQFIGQAVGLMRLHHRWPSARLPFKMRFYPWPVLLTVLGWAALFVALGWRFALGGIGVIGLGAAAFLFRAAKQNEWPFAEEAR
jgi:fructoselysine transporter